MQALSSLSGLGLVEYSSFPSLLYACLGMKNTIFIIIFFFYCFSKESYISSVLTPTGLPESARYGVYRWDRASHMQCKDCKVKFKFELRFKRGTQERVSGWVRVLFLLG